MSDWSDSVLAAEATKAGSAIIIIIIISNDSIYPGVSIALRTGNKVSCQPNDCPKR